MLAVVGTSASDTESVVVAGSLALLALVHLIPRFLPRPVATRPTLLSFAGGVSLVYAFVHLFPDLDERREAIDGVDVIAFTLAAEHVYAVAFVGLAAFYGLERLATVTRSHEFARDLGPVSDAPVFWVHVAGFAVYNAVVGYALVQGETGADNTALFAVAMALHLFGNDEAMATHHRELYATYGEWILAGAVLVGGAVGIAMTLDPATYTVALGLLTGGIVFNAIKDELPRTRESRYWAFAAGALGYGTVLALV
ncbi:hypothetical protein [Halovivax gelatinilyticus]|uniref:hypothetical protein n=1 Tax=Halovivax gelatinilyticus TaxID=2961597 RepID=UPI0020CA2ECB|nr:hypothetical protein [Halovivax gelatinilyticus]